MRAAVAVMLCCACTLDPRTVIDKAALHVQVKEIPSTGTTLVLTAADTKGRQLVKRPVLTGAGTLEVIFEEGTLTAGELDVGAVVLDAKGRQLACGAGRTAAGETFTLFVSLANDEANCGACGKTCSAPEHSTVSCDTKSASCGKFTCAQGWYDVNGDASDGCETTCAAPVPENNVVTCKNGSDDDCDGKTDCADPKCAGFTRGCTFAACQGVQTWDCATDTWSACSANEGLENTMAACGNGLDDDCDGKTDCQDPGCTGFTQSCAFFECGGTQTWSCASKTWGACMVDSKPEVCGNGVDDDCDGKADCADTDCQSNAESTPALCGNGKDDDCDGKVDCADPDCANNGGESVISACGDGKDNDCDGKTDCQDTDCTNIRQGCGGNICASGLKLWLCSAQLFAVCVPYVSLPENSALSCGDNLDNDCDGKTDCGDDSCLGQGCGGNRKCCANGTCAATCP